MSLKVDTARTWFRRVWEEQDEKAIADMFVPDGRAMITNSDPVIGPEEFLVFHRQLLSMFTDVKFEFTRHLEDDDWLAVMGTLKATDRATSEELEVPGQMWVRISDGKIIEAHNSFDFASMFEKASRLPANTIGRLFEGESLT